MYKLKLEDVSEEDIKFIRNNAEGLAFGAGTRLATDDEIRQIVIINDAIAKLHNEAMELEKLRKNIRIKIERR